MEVFVAGARLGTFNQSASTTFADVANDYICSEGGPGSEKASSQAAGAARNKDCFVFDG